LANTGISQLILGTGIGNYFSYLGALSSTDSKYELISSKGYHNHFRFAPAGASV